MAQVNKRTTETKYVTLLADARPDVDVTFRDAVLTRPTDHYLVGVDNFTLCSSGFSMIEPRLDRNHTDLIRIVRKPAIMVAGLHNATADLPQGVRTIERLIFDHGATITGFLDAGINARIDSTVIITSVQQLLERLNRMADIVNTAMHIGIAQQTLQGHILRGYVPVANEETVPEVSGEP